MGLVAQNAEIEKLTTRVSNLENTNNSLQKQNEEIQKQIHNSTNKNDIDWDSLEEKAKEKDASQWEAEKNSQKPNLDVEWN